jgi:hypothetical protein
MKIDISSKEILDFLNGGDVAVLKEKLSGSLLAAADSAEMEEAVKKRVEDTLQKAFDNAFTVERRWGEVHLKGWAVDTVKEWVRIQLGNRSIEAIIRDEAKRAISEILPDLTQQVISAINREEIAKAVAEEMVKQNIQATVHAEVRATLERMYGAVKHG